MNRGQSMDPAPFDTLITRMGTTRVTRMTALRGLLGGAAVVLTAVGIAPSDVLAAKANRKSGNRRKAQRRKVQDTSASVVPTSDTSSPDPVVIEDPCDAFPDTSCGIS
jgi:hypothetical protein